MTTKLLIVVLCSMIATVTVHAKAEKPNIVFLLADDMGYGDLGCFGSPVIKSPNLDKLAADGIKLTNCYAASPNCSPARTAILTGRSPYRVGMYDYVRFRPMHIPKSETTIAETLRAAGYATMFAGKWHCSGSFNTQPNPGDHGFDHWYAHPHNFGKDADGFYRNGKKEKAKGWMSEVVVNEAISWLDKRDTSKPFITMLWFSEPHVPVLAADEFQVIYDNKESRAAAATLKFGGPQVKRRVEPDKMKLYFGCITMLDHHIGRLMTYLGEKGLRDNTVVIFTSDNGPEHRTPTAFGSPGDLRGAKGHMHEGGYRVPGIIRWPGKIKPGSQSAEPVNGTDYLPSLTALAGGIIPTDRPIDGTNVFPALLTGKLVGRKMPMMWWLWHARGGKEVTMRHGDYKIMANMVPQWLAGSNNDTTPPPGVTTMDFIKKSELGNFELFNLAKAPYETAELSKSEPEHFYKLRKMMINLHAEIRAEGPIYDLGGIKKKSIRKN